MKGRNAHAGALRRRLPHPGLSVSLAERLPELARPKALSRETARVSPSAPGATSQYRRGSAVRLVLYSAFPLVRSCTVRPWLLETAPSLVADASAQLEPES